MAVPDPLRALVEAGVEGDDAAVAELVRRTQASVWQLCSILGSPGEEEDLVQETYLRAFGALPSYAGDAPVLAWLLSIARRVCADHVRRRQRQRRVLDRVRRLVRLGDDRDLRQLPAAAQHLDAVRLMTIHGAKGLEFGGVHVPGLNSDTIPRTPPSGPTRTLTPRSTTFGGY